MQGLGVPGTRFFWRLFASYSVVLLVTAALTYLFVQGRVDDAVARGLESSLKNATLLVSRVVGDDFPADASAELQGKLRELKAETGYRVTLIAEDGRVTGDSHEEPARMSNHGHRPEVVEARASDFGVSMRESRTVGYPMMYVARLHVPTGTGVVRVAVPLTHLEERRERIRFGIVLGTCVGLLVALGLGLLVAQRTTAPIAEMRQVADDLRRGDYQARIRNVPQGEIGVLADTLNLLSAELAERIATMTSEDSRLRAMLAGMVEGVVAVDASDRIAFINRAARELLDVRSDAVHDRGLWEVVRVAGLEDLLAGARETGGVVRRELRLGLDGGRTLEAHASPFQTEDSDEAAGLVVVLHDVTDLRRLERVRRDFVANVSHELKTPLTSIKGFVETLLDGAIDDGDNNRRFLGRIDDNVERLSHLVTDLLSLARVESQEGSIQRVPVDWAEVVRVVAERARGPAERKGLKLHLDTVAGPVHVLGDAEGLTQVANNLIENAINYTPAPGEVWVRLGTDGDRALLEVEDTGVGIPPEDLERVFERFYRVDKARSRALGGTGLGLSIIRNLVRQMDGSVRVESEIDRGSHFLVEIPLA
ncbi:MAG: ATP-binding protein [Planctomycetota bacterium]